MSESVYDLKIAEARKIIEDHNNLSKTTQIDCDKVFQKLIELGGTTDQALINATWEDLEDCGIPKMLARTITNQVFRKTEMLTKILTADQIAQMSFRELLENFDPKLERNSNVTKRLKEESNNRPFLIYNQDNTINIDQSVKLLTQIIDNEFIDNLTIVIINNEPIKVYRIGEKLSSTVEENPLYPNTSLLNGSICKATHRSWEGVALKIKQLLYLAVAQTKELKINNAEDVHRIHDLIHVENAETKIRLRYVKAAVLLQELEKTQNAPTLLIMTNKINPNDPFLRHLTT